MEYLGSQLHKIKYKGYLKGLITLIKTYSYVPVGRKTKWREDKELDFNYKSEVELQSLGRKAKDYLLNADEVQELLDLILDKVVEFGAEEIDLYISEETKSRILLNIILFDNGQRVSEPFSVEVHTELSAVEFGIYTLNSRLDINLYVSKSYQNCREIDYLDEHYEIGQAKEVKERKYCR